MKLTTMLGRLRTSLSALFLVASFGACVSIDCPLDNQVVMTLTFFDSATGASVNISDSLSVFGLKDGKEEILFNRGISLKSITLPLNQASDFDTLLLVFHNETERVEDTLFLQHSRQAHFEAIDCPATTFHRLLSSKLKVHSTASILPIIDSVIISNPNVNYEDVENIKVFFRSSAH